jgi:hypothetical protein
MSFPTLLYMFVGFSQVMISIECVVAYKNLAYKEDDQLSVVERNTKIEQNSRRLRWVYVGAAVAAVVLTGVFATFTILLMINKCATQQCDKTS